MPIEVGSKAPDFTLKSSNGPGEKNDFGLSDVTLSANNGEKNTVVLFFPLAFTGVCTKEMCDITAGLSGYSDLNADVIAISVDSPFAQGQWAEKENIGVTIASDLNKQTARDYRMGVAGIPKIVSGWATVKTDNPFVSGFYVTNRGRGVIGADHVY